MRYRVATVDSENEVCCTFMVTVDKDMPEKAVVEKMRDAVRAYVRTPEGKLAILHECGYFNWGDALIHIDNDFWKEYGLTVISDEVMSITLEHEESFVPDEGQTEGEKDA